MELQVFHIRIWYRGLMWLALFYSEPNKTVIFANSTFHRAQAVLSAEALARSASLGTAITVIATNEGICAIRAEYGRAPGPPA